MHRSPQNFLVLNINSAKTEKSRPSLLVFYIFLNSSIFILVLSGFLLLNVFPLILFLLSRVAISIHFLKGTSLKISSPSCPIYSLRHTFGSGLFVILLCRLGGSTNCLEMKYAFILRINVQNTHYSGTTTFIKYMIEKISFLCSCSICL